MTSVRLNDPLVTQFEFENKTYEIDLAFDNVLDVYDVLQKPDLRDIEKIDLALELLIGEYEPENAVALWNYIYNSFIHTETTKVIQYDLQGNPMPDQEDDGNEDKLYDLVKDADYIYSAFRQAYHINLMVEQGRLHWNEFKALLNALPSNTFMKRIMEIRGYKPKRGDPAEYRSQMEDLQKKFALNTEDGEEGE